MFCIRLKNFIAILFVIVLEMQKRALQYIKTPLQE